MQHKIEKLNPRYKERRMRLRRRVERLHTEDRPYVILIPSAIEDHYYRFRQDRQFYYLSGLKDEPGSMLALFSDETDVLYVPDYQGIRDKWVGPEIRPDNGYEEALHFDAVKFLGKPCRGYSFSPMFHHTEYAYLIQVLQQFIDQGGVIYTSYTPRLYGQSFQAQVIHYIISLLAATADQVMPIGDIITHMRMEKDEYEIEMIRRAITITGKAHEVASQVIAPGVNERDVQAEIEKIFTTAGSQHKAFNCIVGSGVNSTVLHYIDNNKQIEAGDMVVVDIGAEYEMYTADITRTYCAGGTMSARQQEIYELVCATQDHIAALACSAIFKRQWWI